MIPTLSSPREAGLHSPAIKRALNESKDGRLLRYAEQLANDLPAYIQTTSESAASRRSYRLSRGIRNRALASTSSRKDEDRLEASIHEAWRTPRTEPFLRDEVTGEEIVRFTPASQVPMFGTKSKDGWGYIDLLGCGPSGLPVVIELKIRRNDPVRGAQPPETLLRAMIEALAYVTAIRANWKHFQPEWNAVVIEKVSKTVPSDLSIVVLGTADYWAAVRSSTWYPQAKTALPGLLAAMKEAGVHCHFASAHATCAWHNRRRWTVDGVAQKEVLA